MAGWNDVTGLHSSAHGIPGAPYRPFPNRLARVESQAFSFKKLSRKRRAYGMDKEGKGIGRTLRECKRFSGAQRRKGTKIQGRP